MINTYRQQKVLASKIKNLEHAIEIEEIKLESMKNELERLKKRDKEISEKLKQERGGNHE